MENISVSVRVRPLNKQELSDGFAWKIEKNSLCQVDPKTRELERARDAKYALDHVFGPQQSTRELYETTTQGLIRKLVNGFNSTVFAYGQTSSGKTHTMRGTPDQPGIIPMAVQEVFTIIEAMQDREFLLRVSYMELYNEDINDLLAPENIKLPIHESKENGVYVAGLREDIVVSPEQVLELIQQGEANRHIGATKMNEGSSRSHTVFRMVIESRAIDSAAEDPAANPDAGAILVSTLTLVDLAGSERVAKTGAEGIRMKEGTAINKSLLTLGNVINKLSDGAAVAGGHIPYRDSKLTRILQPSLGGNAKTAIICNMTPAACHSEESHSTLRFACRAKRVVNNAVVNEVLSDAAVLKRQANEIAELRKALATAGNADVEEQIGHLRAQLLRSEQDNELMRIKLEQETAEREKAQKQVEMAKKIMFDKQQEQVTEEGGSRKNNRRETWCPGRSGWAPPFAEGGSRKRALVEEDTMTRSMMLSVLEEEEESDEPPTKVKRPSDAEMEDTSAEPGDSDSPVPELPPSVHVRKSSVISGKGNSELVEMLQSRVRELESESETTKQELAESAQQLQQHDEALRAARTQIQELTGTSAELSGTVEQLTVDKEKLVPQLEQARWQNRQLEKKLEDMAAAKAAAEQAVSEAQEAAAAAVDAADSREQQLQSRVAELTKQNSKLKEQFEDLNSSCLDLKGQLEVQITQVSMLEARQKQHEQQTNEQAGRLRGKTAELESIGKQLQAANAKLGEVEERSRELYDCNQRLEAHVHDLESRRRAPLYQKKQEEELKAALDKALEADTRAHEAELKAEELKESMYAAVKQLAELQEKSEAAQKAAADEAARTTAAHTIELQKLQVERAKLETTHEAALVNLQAEVQRAKEAHQSLEGQLSARDATIAEYVLQLQHLHAAEVDLQNQLGESQACATAAKDRIEALEQEAEAATTEHQQALEAATQALREAQEAAMKQLQEAQDAASAQAQQVADAHVAEVAKVQAELNAVKIAAEGEVHQLQASLDSTSELLKKVMETATATEAAAAEAKAAAQKEVDAMKAKLAEAAGVLNAKEELREARVKHKQELAAIKQELTKLQQESKSGQKSKDVTAKELDGTKKKLQDVEAKLKVAISDKQAAMQDKANLERQLKQLNSKSTILEKNLEKKDVQAEKRRESIMVGLSKTRDQLSVSEERIKQLQLENQRTHMDLLAKTGECSSLEKQLTEVQASEATLTQAKAALETKLAECEALLASTTATKGELQGSVESLMEQLAGLEASSADLENSMKDLQAAHSKVCMENKTLSDDLAQLHTSHKQLQLEKEVLDTQLGTLQPAHAELRQLYDSTISELQTTKAALQKAQEARVHAEGRLPEIEVLQKQISKAHEEMSDLRFKLEEQRAAAAAKEQQLQADKQHLESHLEAAVHQKERVQLEATAATTRASQHEKQLEELYELCTSQQSKLQSLMDEKKALELRADNLSGELQKSKSSLCDMDSKCQQLQALVEDLKVQHQQQAVAAEMSQQLAAKEEELQRLVASSSVEVQAWQLKMQEVTADHKNALQQVQSQLDQAYNDLSELQFSADHEKVQLEAQLQQTREQLKVAESKLAAEQACSLEEAQQPHQELRQVQSAYAAAMNQMQQLQQELANVQQLLSAAQHDKTQIQSTAESLTAKLQQTQQELADMQQTVGVLQDLQKQQSDLNDQLQELQAAQQAAEEAVGLAQQQLHGAQTEYQAVQQQLEMAQQLQPAVDAQLVITQAAVEEQQQQLQQVTSMRYASEQASLAAQQQLHEQQQACRTAEDCKSELEAQIAALQDSCRDLEVQLQQLREQRALGKQTSDQLQPQQPAAAAASETASEPVGSVLAAGELEALRQQAATAEQLHAEVQSLRLELQELEQLHHQNMEVAGFTTSISRDPSTPARSRDHLKWEITSLGDELKAAEQRRKAAEQQLVCKDNQLEELQEQIADLQQHLQEAVKSQGSGTSYAAVLKGGEAPIASDWQQICTLEGQVQHLRQHVTELQQQASRDAAEVERLSGLLVSAKQPQGASSTGAPEVVVLKQEKLDAEQQARQLQQQVEQLSAECQVLRHSVEQHRTAAAAAESANIAAQQQIGQLSAECQTLRLEVSKHQAAATAASAAASAKLRQTLAAAERDIKQLQDSLLTEQQSKGTLQDEVSALKAAMEELAVSNNQLQQQLAAAGQAEAQVQQLQAKLSEAEQLKDLVEQLTAENSQAQQQLLQSQAAANSATQLQQELAHHAQKSHQLQQQNQQLRVQLTTQSQQAQQEMQEAENLRKMLQQQQIEVNKHSAKADQLIAAMEHLQTQLAALQAKSSAEVEALVAHDSHQIKQIEVLKAELARMRGSNRTESLAALHNEALQEARSLADTKQAELNAKVLQLESHIHWLQQDNERLQDECNKQAASAAVSSDADQQGSADQGSLAQLQERLAALESELRKSKRAGQKLQALLYRLRQDVEQLPTKPGMFDQLQEVRSLEYEVDFLTNKCKKYERILHQTVDQKQATNKTAASSKAGEGAQAALQGLTDKENVQYGR